MILQRNNVGGRSLKHIKLSCLFSHFRDHLNAARARSDHRHPLARESRLLLRPTAGHVLLASKAIQPFEDRVNRCGDKPRCHDAILRGDDVATIGGDRPTPRGLVKGCGHDLRLKLDFFPKVEAICNVIGVALNLGLCCVAFCPFPLLLQLLGKGVGVLHTLDIDTGAGVTVPIPGTPYSIASLKALDR